jgi:hypothetical protein
VIAEHGGGDQRIAAGDADRRTRPEILDRVIDEPPPHRFGDGDANVGGGNAGADRGGDALGQYHRYNAV